MICRKCGNHLRVINTADDNTTVYRARMCPKCRDVIYTAERQDDKSENVLRRLRTQAKRESIERRSKL